MLTGQRGKRGRDVRVLGEALAEAAGGEQRVEDAAAHAFAGGVYSVWTWGCVGVDADAGYEAQHFRLCIDEISITE